MDQHSLSLCLPVISAASFILPSPRRLLTWAIEPLQCGTGHPLFQLVLKMVWVLSRFANTILDHILSLILQIPLRKDSFEIIAVKVCLWFLNISGCSLVWKLFLCTPSMHIYQRPMSGPFPIRRVLICSLLTWLVQDHFRPSGYVTERTGMHSHARTLSFFPPFFFFLENWHLGRAETSVGEGEQNGSAGESWLRAEGIGQRGESCEWQGRRGCTACCLETKHHLVQWCHWDKKEKGEEK